MASWMRWKIASGASPAAEEVLTLKHRHPDATLSQDYSSRKTSEATANDDR